MGKFTDNPRATNRPLIEKKMLGRGATLDITHGGERYLVPHDELVGWVGENLNALNTISWRDKGLYSWPKAPDLMVEFLRRYQIPVS
ncbi:hypothetical protein [Primorskyibacter sp. S87]|uniref:hypothetical protein n=1 Tax=Primorskyibacter sp. S87 TaxID=3415126 RepID=UPI003C7D418B